MDKEVELVFQGYVSLKPDQKKELIKKLNDYINGSSTKQKQMEETTRKANLGPTAASVCVCCGR